MLVKLAKAVLKSANNVLPSTDVFQIRPAADGAGLPAEWPLPEGRRKGWEGCSLRRSWSQSGGRTGGFDPSQLEPTPHPCPARLNLKDQKV